MRAIPVLFIGAIAVLCAGILWLLRPPAFVMPPPPEPAAVVVEAAPPTPSTPPPAPPTLAELLRLPPDLDLFPVNRNAPLEDPDLGVPDPLVLNAVVGEEFRLYFDNLGFFYDMDRMRIFADCTCRFGQMQRRYWGGAPGAGDVGEHIVNWFVSDAQGREVRRYKSTLRVAPRAPRRLDTLRAFFLGDSITRQQFWPNFVFDHLLAHVANDVTTIGRVAFSNETLDHYRTNSRPGLRSESYNGWPTFFYLNENFRDFSMFNPESDVSRSPFWFGPDLNEGELSFRRFVDVHGDGRMPDIAFIMLGTNDVPLAAFRPSIVDEKTVTAVRSLERIIAMLRQDKPDLQIFIVNPPPISGSSSAWHGNYGEPGDMHSPLSMKFAHRWMSGAYHKAFGGREADGIHYIPAHVGMDPIDGYHLEQVVHPSEFGHRQIANAVNAYLNRWLAEGAGGLAARH